MSPDTSAQPLDRLRRLIGQAAADGASEPNVAALATSDSTSGRPSARAIYVHVDADSIVFFVNGKSGKGVQLEWNPQAALCFFWPVIEAQVTLEGTVEKLDDATADTLWRQRPRESALAARVSRQHARGSSDDESDLGARLADEKRRAGFSRVERPAHWIGYRLLADRIEFWDTGWRRMRLRHLFERHRDGHWNRSVQEP